MEMYHLVVAMVYHIMQIVLKLMAQEAFINNNNSNSNSNSNNLLVVITDFPINIKVMVMIRDILLVTKQVPQQKIVDVIIVITLLKQWLVLLKLKEYLSQFDFDNFSQYNTLFIEFFLRQLIGQRSSSVLDNEAATPTHSPAESEAKDAKETQHRHRHHHRRRSGEHAGFSQTRQSHQTQGHTSAAADGYGHINDDLIFIERGEHSPHRQEPPPGYEYKGKIEVQGIDNQYRSQSHGQGSAVPQGPTSVPMPNPFGQPASISHCPPGWQQLILSAAPGGPCPPGGAMYAGQLIVGGGMAQAGLGGIGGFGGSAAGVGFGGGQYSVLTLYLSFCSYILIFVIKLDQWEQLVQVVDLPI
jgi:hypothetical protein